MRQPRGIRAIPGTLTAILSVGCASASCAAASLRIDVNDTTQPELTQPGFAPFLRTSNPATYGSVSVHVTGVGIILSDHDRVRATPTENGPFSESALLRDFIFAPMPSGGGANTSGLNVRVGGLVPFGVYDGSLWSFDTSSTGPRTADWFGNGKLLREDYEFNGVDDPPSPPSNDRYRIDFSV